jgi:sugar fermentation stimulation protein A
VTDRSGKAGPLVPAFFLARPNRFVVEAVLGDGRRVAAHLADPGRLRELLVPGAPLRLRPVPIETARKTRYTVALVRSAARSRAWVSVDTSLPNRLAEMLLERGAVRGVGRGWTLQREFRHGRSRFDFRLTRGAETMLVEVKSVSLVEEGIGRFPDAPTQRGTRHVSELETFVREGGRALVLFIVQRHDATSVTSNPRTDPRFAAALARARRSGVILRAAGFRMNAHGKARYAGPLPVRA